MSQKKFFFVKLFVLLLIFFWIIKSVNLEESIKVLSKTNLYYFSLAFLIGNLSNIFLTIKWYRLASPLKIKSKFWDLFALNYISTFYSSFIPGQASGEIIKGLKLARSEGSHQNVWIPIFIDKITNLLVVFIIGFIAILFDKHYSKNTGLVFIVSFLTLLFLFLTIILFTENTSRFIEYLKDKLTSFLSIFKLNTAILSNFSLNYFEEYKKNKLIIFETIIWSLLIKLPHIFGFYFLALSLNLNLDLIESAWFFSIISIVILLPISFSGLGVREGISIFLLSKVGIDNSSALSYSILIFLIGVLIALIGGVFELFYGHELGNKVTSK